MRAHHLVVIGVTDQDDGVPVARVADGFEMHLGDERARGVDHPQPHAGELPRAPRARCRGR